MKTSFFEQAAKALKSRSNRTRWLSVTLCLALMVSAGTFYAFMRQGQAQVRTEKLLVCQFVPHEHDDSCFGVDEDGEIDENVILCGMADFVLHSHTDDCYDENGRLICELPEIEEHQHDSSCYSYHEYLVCDHEDAEAEGHHHTDECYEERVIEDEDEGDNEPEETTDACTQEEHVHTSDCYTKTETAGERVLTCSATEHTHDDSCYTETTTDTLTCTASEHVHGDSCYTPIYSEELTCSDSSEEHSHDSGCYTSVQTSSELTCGESEHSHDGGCYTTETTRELTCGETEHTHDDSCYTESDGETVEELTCGKTEHTHDETCSGSSAAPSEPSEPSEPKTERVLICGQEEAVSNVVHTSDCYETEEELTCDQEELTVHVHDDSCYDEDDNLICGKLEIQEHIHGPECFIEVTVGVDDPKYVCGKTYHVHEDGCYSEDGRLLCPLEEHEHGDECLAAPQERWICGMTAHKHDESCYNDALELVCGLEEHEHTDKCLPEPEWLCGKMEHTHDESCYDASGELVCPLEEHQHTGLCMNPALQPEPEWKCGRIAHTHGADCYDEDGNLICELKEHEHTNLCLKSEDEVSWLCGKTAHTHDESCYDEDGVLVCGLEEHEHTYDCLKDHAIEWLCGKTEHKHGPDCYDENGELVCELEEHKHSVFCLMDEIKDEDCICGKIAHIHDESCYDENGELVCGLEEHVHTAECLPEEIKWLCGKVEHRHDESCYDENGVLVCGLEEHTHTAACLVEQDGRWLCGKIEHTHGPECYDENGELICELEEHTHTEDCLMLPETVMVAQEHNYATASGLFDITFRVEGPAILRLDPSAMPETPDETPVPSEDPDPDGVTSPDENNDAPEAVPVDENVPASEDENAPAPEDTTPADDSDGDQPEEPAEAEREFRFQIDELDAVKDVNAEALEALTLFTQKAEEQDENLLEALSVYLYCDGERLDLSDCKVTAEIKPTELLRQMVAEMEANAALAIEDPEADPDAEPAEPQETPAIALRLTAVEAAENEEIKELDTIYITSDDAGSVPVASGTETEDVDAPVDADASDGEQSQEPVTEEPEKTELKTMTVTMRSNNVALYGEGTTKPEFEVQYYAYIDQLKKNTDVADGTFSSSTQLNVIDTSASRGGGGLPVNGNKSTAKVMQFTRKSDGSLEYEKNVLIPLFQGRPIEFTAGQMFSHYDILPDVEGDTTNNYDAKEIWVLNTKSAGEEKWIRFVKDETETQEDKQSKEESIKNYKFESTILVGPNQAIKSFDALEFVNNPYETGNEVVKGNCVLIDESTVIRMVYDATTDTKYRNAAAFYDYDISDGKIYETASTSGTSHEVTTRADQETLEQAIRTRDNLADATTVPLYMYTEKQGINSHAGQELAFGNGEGTVLTGLGDKTMGGYNINQQNAATNYGRCVFKLAQDSLVDKKIAFNVNAPNIFEGTATGKTGFGGTLHFIRNGDTYTLSSVSGSNSVASNLDKLHKSRPNYNATQWIYSNDFWPMDAAETWGAEGHDMMFGKAIVTGTTPYPGGNVDAAVSTRGYSLLKNGTSKSLPNGDYYADHNAYFGMNLAIEFNLTADYLGPLEYIFFGDDDMWVYLVGEDGSGFENGKLVCDIGGVHPSVGEYVNLRDYLPEGKSGRYWLYIYYTERGASGSTCWMQFTLPQVSSKPVEVGGGTLKNTVEVNKTVSGAEVDPNQKFLFEIKFEGLGAERNLFNATIYRANGEKESRVVANHGEPENNAYGTHPDGSAIKNNEFYLGHDETIRIEDLPKGTTYKITEKALPPGFELEGSTVTGSGSEISGTIKPGDNTSITEVNLVNRTSPRMPETGGEGTTTFSVLGAGLLLGGMLLVLRRKREE